MFRLTKTIEASAFLLEKLGGEMPYIKLVKLLYLADREMLEERGRTITGDSLWAMKYGPVLGHTLELIKNGGEDWDAHLSTDTDAKIISLILPAPPEALSGAEVKVLGSVAEKFGRMDWMTLVEYTHELPEWLRNPVSKGRRKIELSQVLDALGKTRSESESIIAAERERTEISGALTSLQNPLVHA